MPETKRVWWIGGPFDGQMFRVPYSQKTVHVGETVMGMDLDTDTRLKVAQRTESELYITCRKNRYYVIWPTDG
jgi:hypothetical protein